MPQGDSARFSTVESSAGGARARRPLARLGALLLLGPHLVLGGWLFAVPDYRAFLVAQVVTLAHVALAAVTLPPALVWIFVHVRRRSRPAGRSAVASVSDWLLLGVALVAFSTGVAVVHGGDIVRVAPLHALAGLGVAIPLAWHLWLAARRPFAVVVMALLVASLGVALVGRRFLPPAAATPVTPAFAYVTRPASLYDPAASCGECHKQDYDDWKRTTHARGLQLASVKRDLAQVSDGTTMTLADVGHVAAGGRGGSLDLLSGVCRDCHAPVGFYGDDARSASTATGTLAEGTTCTVCHTLREVRESSEGKPNFAVSDPRYIAASMARMPQYVSAPETVRRYLGQGSNGKLAHEVGNWLIRWRPDVHKADYHSEILDSSRACEGCHSLGGDDPSTPLVYVSWQHSAYRTNEAATTVSCQDCHMTRHMTGKRVRDPERAVAWGPVRPNSRSHLFLGGNVRAAIELGDMDLARLEHAYNEQAMSVQFLKVDALAGAINATLSVRSTLIGHNFPGLESQIRYGWVQVKAFDAADNLLGTTDPPRGAADFDGPSPLIMAPMEDPGRGILGSQGTLELRARLGVPSSPPVAYLRAEVHHGMDPDPIATSVMPLAQAPGPCVYKDGILPARAPE
jgi:hypothetical protein